jgi:hypothetical protein
MDFAATFEVYLDARGTPSTPATTARASAGSSSAVAATRWTSR